MVHFSDSHHSMELLEAAQARRQIELEMDKKSGGYVIRRVIR
jgi:hypothetical protein